MLEEDIDFQERDNCKNVELPNKQEIDREMVVWPNMSLETSYEQEICVVMKIVICPYQNCLRQKKVCIQMK